MENARIAPSELDSDISTHVWMLGEIGIRLEYDFPNQCKRIAFTTRADYDKVLSRIANTVLFSHPGKEAIRWRDLTRDSEGKIPFFDTL